MNFWFWFAVALVCLIFSVGLVVMLVMDVRSGKGGGWSDIEAIRPKGEKE